MNTFKRAGYGFTGSRLAETVAEVGLTVAAAGFTAAIWLSIATWAVAPESPAIEAAAQSGKVRYVTLPTVVIVGNGDSLEGTPATTTAQNTAANPITLSQ